MLKLDVTDEDERIVDELVSITPPEDRTAKAMKEAILAKLTAALAAGRARDATIISGANLVLLLVILFFK